MQGLQYMTTRVQTSYKLRSQRYRPTPNSGIRRRSRDSAGLCGGIYLIEV